MAVTGVLITVDTRNTKYALDLLEATISPTSLAYFLATDAHETILDRMESRFTQEGDDASGPWAPLAYMTQQIRRSMGLGDQHPINVRTGDFLDWLRNAQPAIQYVRATGVKYTYPGTMPSDPQMVKKFKTSQQGQKSRPVTVARPALAMNETDLGLITGRLEAYVNRHMAGSTI